MTRLRPARLMALCSVAILVLIAASAAAAAESHRSLRHGTRSAVLGLRGARILKEDKGLSLRILKEDATGDDAAANSTGAGVAEAGDASAADAPAEAPDASDVKDEEEVPAVLFQAHGWLMWAGFGVLMPVGIITSRHLQTVTKVWFYVHIACMSLAVSCIIAGGAIAFARFDAIPGTPSDDIAYLHITLGTAVFILALLNFLLGLVRPHKGQRVRVPWYLAHFTLGTATTVLAWYLIFTGMNLYEDQEEGADLNILKNLFTASIAVLGFAYLLLGRWDYAVGQLNKDSPLDGVTSLPWKASSRGQAEGKGIAPAGEDGKGEEQPLPVHQERA